VSRASLPLLAAVTFGDAGGSSGPAGAADGGGGGKGVTKHGSGGGGGGGGGPATDVAAVIPSRGSAPSVIPVVQLLLHHSRNTPARQWSETWGFGACLRSARFPPLPPHAHRVAGNGGVGSGTRRGGGGRGGGRGRGLGGGDGGAVGLLSAAAAAVMAGTRVAIEAGGNAGGWVSRQLDAADVTANSATAATATAAAALSIAPPLAAATAL